MLDVQMMWLVFDSSLLLSRGNLNNKSVVPEGREAEARPSAGEIVLASAEITI
jgi:hypothetical protein